MTNLQGSTCPICGKISNSIVFRACDSNRQTTEELFDIYMCTACSIGMTSPQLEGEALSAAYPKSYYNLSHAMEVTNVRSGVYRYQLAKVKTLQQFAGNGALLDFGAGIGSFVYAASRNGFDASGIEMSRYAVEFGREHFGINIMQGDLSALPQSGRKYDVITLWHVLEHIAAPAELLGRVKNALRSGGILVVAVPNFGSFQAKLFRSKWYHLDVPRHLYHYSVPGLTKFLEQNEFSVETVDHYSYEHNWAGFLGSLMDIRNLESESFIHKLIRKTAGEWITRLLAWIESSMKHGGTITVVARNRAPGAA